MSPGAAEGTLPERTQDFVSQPGRPAYSRPGWPTKSVKENKYINLYRTALLAYINLYIDFPSANQSTQLTIVIPAR